jgi:hypothetical protein
MCKGIFHTANPPHRLSGLQWGKNKGQVVSGWVGDRVFAEKINFVLMILFA